MAVRIILLCLIVVAVGWGMKWLESRVRATTSSARNIPVRLQTAARPDWMPAELAYKITRCFAPKRTAKYNDQGLTDWVFQRAQANPWVKEVRSVRKGRDADGRPFVRVGCDFRRPAAMVAWQRWFYFVDDQGVRLSDSRRDPHVPRWTAVIPGPGGRGGRRVNFVELADVPTNVRRRRIHYVIIELDGELDPPAPEAGQKWDSKALTTGLRLARLLKTRKYFNQVTYVDARNYGGRRSLVAPHLSFSAGNSTFKFGRFPHPDGVDHNVSIRQKMANLDRHVARYRGRLAGTPDLNLQLEDPYDSGYSESTFR